MQSKMETGKKYKKIEIDLPICVIFCQSNMANGLKL